MSVTDAKADSRLPVRVTIFHQNYTLVSQGDPSEMIQVAREVDELMHTIAERAGSGDASRVAVLACLHLADRMRVLEALKVQLNHRAEEFSMLLEKVLEPEPAKFKQAAESVPTP
jgi:cell division protein ZapA